jgi:hypothetical protein
MSSLEYIDRFKAIAIQEMNSYGIPASITLAQGLFESAAATAIWLSCQQPFRYKMRQHLGGRKLL